MKRRLLGLFAVTLLLAWTSSCDDETQGAAGGAGLSGQTGQVCAIADDCFVDVDTSAIAGDIQCLDRVSGGYCTHTCTTDGDCCAVPGECGASDTQVCGPFESTGMMMCFISCEKGDFEGNADAHCQAYHPDFICRSTGGGSANRKVCVPGGNGACTRVEDCPVGYESCCENALGDLRCYDASAADGLSCL